MLSKFNELKTENYSSHGNNYKLTIYKAQNGDEIRIYISKNEEGEGTSWTLDDLEVSLTTSEESVLVEKCLSMAKVAIEKNESEA